MLYMNWAMITLFNFITMLRFGSVSGILFHLYWPLLALIGLNWPLLAFIGLYSACLLLSLPWIFLSCCFFVLSLSDSVFYVLQFVHR